jgi:6-pyruvoyltetrahydropterin/6-carboxytetrahydropterin synthase
MRVCKIFRFDAAHFLPGYEGPCAALHGHGWVLEVEVEGPIGSGGMVLDFALLKRCVWAEALMYLDHHLLNDLIKMPTAENILLWVAQRLQSTEAWTPSENPLSRLRLYETPDSFAELELIPGGDTKALFSKEALAKT